MTSPTLPYLHRNARSRQITREDLLEVFAEEITRGLTFESDEEHDRYLKEVMGTDARRLRKGGKKRAPRMGA